MPSGSVRQLRRPITSNVAPGQRWKTKWPAKLRTGVAQTPCTVVNVSVAGARLRVDHAPDKGSIVLLFIGNADAIVARVVWCDSGLAGLRFVEDQPWILSVIPTAKIGQRSLPTGRWNLGSL
jgi:PilZ domain-containing protein